MGSKQDILTSIKNLDLFLRVPALKGAKARINKNGNPFVFVGGFNMVFQLTHKSKKWAFRVWHVPMGENAERYRKISNYLFEKKLPYFAEFIYDEKGILVNGELLDTIRMEWLEGKLLKEYIEENLSNKSKLTKLASDFLEMCKSLRENKISHGDLQEGNILIDKSGKIKLVDYDSVCVPGIEGQKELVTGLKGYQHPSRFKSIGASLKADHFSELIIYISILAISENSNLWNKYQVKDTQYLLFNENDFEDFENSDIYKDLHKLSVSIKCLTRILFLYINEINYLNLLPIESYLTAPVINYFKANEVEVLQGKSVELSWSIENVDTIKLNNSLGNVASKSKQTVYPNKTTVYKLTAENSFGKTEQEMKIIVLPLPKITEFSSNQQKIEHGNETQLVWNIENAQKVELHYIGNIEVISKKGEKTISPSEHTTYKLLITALDGITKEEKEVIVKVFKKIEIKFFVSDFEFVVESLPIQLSWKTENATHLILTSNYQADIDVTGKNNIEQRPKRNTIYYLKARNDLFTNTSQIEIDVQKLPSMPRLHNIIPDTKSLIPTFELDFKNISNNLLSDSEVEFDKIMQSQKSFNLKNSLKSLLKTIRDENL